MKKKTFFKDLDPKYENLEIYIDKENFGLIEIPQISRFEFAKTMYADREVLYFEDHNDRMVTEVLLSRD